nr:MAG TPA: hypothetical protein [Caudoviricetes sp.]
MVISSRTFHILKSNYHAYYFRYRHCYLTASYTSNVPLCSSHRFHTQEIRACVSITLGVHVSLSNHLTFKGITDATAVFDIGFCFLICF